MTQTDEVRSGGSYISQSDFRLHFGLGSAEKIESLEVRWPSGKVETFKNLAADRFYALLEEEGVVPAERIRPVSHIRFASEGFWCNGDVSPTTRFKPARTCSEKLSGSRR